MKDLRNKQDYPNAQQLIPQEEEASSFDIMGWISLLLHYWYLFVIAASIAASLAYFSNRKWLPYYQVAAKMIIEDAGYRSGPEAIMQGFGVQQGYKNVNNQIIMLGSSDLIGKAIDNLDLEVDYYTRGRFKYRNLYKKSPIKITADYISKEAYQYEFSFKVIDEVSPINISLYSSFAVIFKAASSIKVISSLYLFCFKPLATTGISKTIATTNNIIAKTIIKISIFLCLFSVSITYTPPILYLNYTHLFTK